MNSFCFSFRALINFLGINLNQLGFRLAHPAPPWRNSRVEVTKTGANPKDYD